MRIQTLFGTYHKYGQGYHKVYTTSIQLCYWKDYKKGLHQLRIQAHYIHWYKKKNSCPRVQTSFDSTLFKFKHFPSVLIQILHKYTNSIQHPYHYIQKENYKKKG